MAFLDINNVAVKGISACVPHISDYISDIYNGGVNSFAESTGIKARRRVLDATTSSDLCLEAAKN